MMTIMSVLDYEFKPDVRLFNGESNITMILKVKAGGQINGRRKDSKYVIKEMTLYFSLPYCGYGLSLSSVMGTHTRTIATTMRKQFGMYTKPNTNIDEKKWYFKNRESAQKACDYLSGLKLMNTLTK
jgi:hypothetical protein